MSARNLLWFYRRRLRARMVQELLALVGIAVGVALLFAVQVSNSSLSASIAQLTEGLVGDAQLQLVARDPHGFDERLLGEVERIDGVRAAAPVLQLQANAVGPRGQRAVTLVAANPQLARLGGRLLSGYTSGRLAAVRAVVLPSLVARTLGVSFGETVKFEIHGRTASAPVGAVVGGDDIGLIADTPVAVAPLAYGQELAGSEGRVSRVFVLADPARLTAVQDALRRVANGHLDVRSADAEGRLFAKASQPNDQSTALFAGISALVGFLFAFNAMLLMARERRGIIAELRMSGFGFRQVLQVLLFDAVLLGLVASAVGIALGDQLSRWVFHPSPGYLAIAFPVGTARVVDWQTVVLAVSCGTLAAVLAAMAPLVAAFSATAMDTVDDDGRSTSVSRRSRAPWLVGGSLAGLAITTIVIVAVPHAAMFGMVTLVASMLLVLPVVLSVVLTSADRLRRGVRSVVPAIAIGELLSARGRSVAIAAIAAIAVFGSTSIEGAHRDLQRGLDPNARELNAVADLWVSPTGDSNMLATTPFRPADALRRIKRVSEVSSTRIYRGSFLDMGDRRVWVIAPPRSASRQFPPSQILDGDLGLATARVRAGGWAVASQAVVDQQGLHVGEPFFLAAPQPMHLRLAAITSNFGWSPGTLVLNADDYRKAWGSADASAIQLRIEGVRPTEGRRLVQHALGANSGLVVQTARQRELRDRDATRQGLARLTQIANLMLMAAALAMAAAMGGMIWQRRRRLADLKLSGIGHRQLWRALLLESVLLLGIGCSVGALYGLYGEQVLNRALTVVTGFPVDDSIGLMVALISLALVTSVAVLIAMLPGYFAARVSPEAAFRD